MATNEIETPEQQQEWLDVIADPANGMSDDDRVHWTEATARDYYAKWQAAEGRLAAVAAVCDALTDSEEAIFSDPLFGAGLAKAAEMVRAALAGTEASE